MVKDSPTNLEKIWNQVPVDYYQNGISNNILQRLWHNGKLKAVTQLIEDSGVSPKKIIDVGCASGWFLSKLWEKYPKASHTGIDVYKPAIEYGQRVYNRLKLICVDGHNLPFKDKSFDLVTCTEVLEHVQDPKKILLEIKRVLTPKGEAIIEMDSGNFLFRIAWYWWTNLRRGVWRDSHIHTFNADVLQNLILKSGFLIVRKETFNLKMAVAFVLKKVL